MTVSVLACGHSGQFWDGSSDSIGVNDCWKWGHPTDYLMVIDSPGRFSQERKRIIENSKPKHFITDSRMWLEKFHNPIEVNRIKPNKSYKELYCTNGMIMKYRFSKWTGKLYNDRISYSHTSPFAAISLAYLLGYKEIILWGVDFVNHNTWNPNNDFLRPELDNYRDLTEQLKGVGVSISLGSIGSMLSEFLPVKI